MGNFTPNSTTDLNLTGTVGGEDLDITWAHLQVKALLDASSDNSIVIGGESINIKDSFALRDAIQKMYDINISSGIASPSLGDVYNPPEMFTSETYSKIWKMHDIFESGRAGKAPTTSHNTLMEARSGEKSGTINGGVTWARKFKGDRYLNLATDAEILLDDDRSLDYPYNISFSFFYEKYGDGIFLRKGDFYLKIKNAWITIGNSHPTKTNLFKLPNDQTVGDLKNKWTHLRLVAVKVPNLTTGVANPTYRVFINNIECEKGNQNLNAVMSLDAVREPFKLVCNPIKSVKDFKVSNSTLAFPEYSEDFQYDISLDKTSSFNYRKFENELIDNAGNYLGIENFPGVNNQSKTWVAKSGSGGPTVSRVARVGGNRRIVANDVDISKDFTVSFWFKAHGTTSKVHLFDDRSNGIFGIHASGTNLVVIFPTKSYTFDAGVDFLNNWTHVVLIKTGENFGLYVNGSLLSWRTVPTQSGIKNLGFGGNTPSASQYDLSSIKILKYAIYHIEVDGWDGLDVDNKITRLMNNNF